VKEHTRVSSGALAGIRIIDLTRVLAGPFCTMLLGDMGAEIVKVETPGVGDDSRRYPPFIGEDSAYFMNLNRNKKSITLNLKSARGKRVFFDLARRSDVIIENFRPGTMDRLGIGYARIKEENPDLIFASISGFGHTGPYRDRPGYDIIGQAMGGIMGVTGWPDSPPTRTGTAIADVLGGLCTCVGILGGLVARKSGNAAGQQIDVALVDSVVSAMETIIQIYLVDQREPQRVGNRYEFIYPYDSFEARNGWVVIGVGNNKLWDSFCKAIGKEALLEEKKYGDNADRVRHHEEIYALVEAWTRPRTVDEVVSFLLERNIPCAPIYTIKDIVSDPHIAGARKMFLEIDHPSAGRHTVIGSPVKMSATPPRVETPAPRLGEHTEEILTGILGYPPETVAAFKRDRIT
jgi:crotonobetainyl-CoA:carnitine CoA-transferase CaiB-like acyl-CoA transferase